MGCAYFVGMRGFLKSLFKIFSGNLVLFAICFLLALPSARGAVFCSSLFTEAKYAQVKTNSVVESAPSNLVLFKRNAFFSVAFRVIAEAVSPYLPKNFNLDQKQLEQLESSEVLLLGRFYKNPDFTLLDLRDHYFPNAQVLDGRLGFGQNLIANIQNIIRGAEKIVIWNNRLDRHSFTYLYEISFIAKHPELAMKTFVTNEKGDLVRFNEWYANQIDEQRR